MVDNQDTVRTLGLFYAGRRRSEGYGHGRGLLPGKARGGGEKGHGYLFVLHARSVRFHCLFVISMRLLCLLRYWA